MATEGISPENNNEMSGSSHDARCLAPQDAWIGECDLDEFRQEIVDLGKKLLQQQVKAMNRVPRPALLSLSLPPSIHLFQVLRLIC